MGRTYSNGEIPGDSSLVHVHEFSDANEHHCRRSCGNQNEEEPMTGPSPSEAPLQISEMQRTIQDDRRRTAPGRP